MVEEKIWREGVEAEVVRSVVMVEWTRGSGSRRAGGRERRGGKCRGVEGANIGVRFSEG